MSFAMNAEPLVTSVAAAGGARRIWVTWEKQRRNATVSQALGCRLFEFDVPARAIIRYPIVLARTLWTFLKERPTLVCVQNPSLVLAGFAVAYGRLFGIPVVVDAHNAAVEPSHDAPPWQLALRRYILKRASLTLLSNQALADAVAAEPGLGPLAVLPDPLPQLSEPHAKPELRGTKNVLFICSWFVDEPYLEVIKAAGMLPSDTCVYITGNSRNRLDGVDVPANVVLTGYVDEHTYLGLLYSCDVIVDLTTWENCLVCGAYEAVSAERSIILSGTQALRRYFHKGVLYTDNTAADLARQIGKAIAGKDTLRRDVRALKQQLDAEWRERREQLDDELSRLTQTRG